MAARPHPRGALYWLVFVAAACNSGGPAAPTSSVAPQTVLQGQVVDQFTGAGVAGVLVGFAGGSALTDETGRFAIVGTPSATARRVSLSGPAIHARETYVADGEARFEVVPAAFDMTAFDDVGREKGGRTIRWLRAPTIYLDTRVLGNAPDPEEMARWIAEIEAHAPSIIGAWTGGAWASAPVVVGSAPPASGAIVIVFDENASTYPGERVAGLTFVEWSVGGVIDESRIKLRFSGIAGPSGALARRAMLAHELGHAVGLGHMDQTLPSVMTPVVRIPLMTEFDASAGRLLYGRPPGNTSVDRDAQATASAALATATAAGAAEWGCPLP